MVSTPLRTNQPTRSVYDFALSRLKKGEAPEDVKCRLVQEGLTEVEAGKVIVDGVNVAVEMFRAIGSRHWRNQDSSDACPSTPPVPSGMAFGSGGGSSG